MRTIVAAGLIAIGLAVGVSAQTPQASSQGPTLRADKKVTVRFVNAGVIDVLKLIDELTELEIRIAPDVRSNIPITLNVTDGDLVDFFKKVVEIAKLDFEVLDEKTARVFPKR